MLDCRGGGELIESRRLLQIATRGGVRPKIQVSRFGKKIA